MVVTATQRRAARRSAPSVSLQEHRIAGQAAPIPLRSYRAVAGARLPLVLYFHGGGFVGGGIDDADGIARALAVRIPALVLVAGYALAPAHPFPAAPEDAWRVALWACAQAKALHVRPESIAVAGDDAGGNLAAVLPMIARDRAGPDFAAQVLIAPMLDPCMTSASMQAGGEQVRDCAACYRQYLPEALQRVHPYAAPLRSRRLAGLPPALVVSAERDRLRDEAESYAAALIAAGVPTQVARYPGLAHGELIAHDAVLREAGDFLRRHLC